MDKLSMQTPNLTAENVEKIEQLFPNCIKESEDEEGNLIKKVDFDLLKAELGDKSSVEGLDERYRLDWPGKKRSILKANTPITKTLRPVKEDSVDWDNTGNLYIEGDNFEILKILQESYLGKIKMIYIDPPYNTGNDFVYNDNFVEDSEEYKEKTEQNSEGYKMVKNTDANGRFHSDWLSMMYERLRIARDLLTDDGVIFMSINDYELNNLHKCCDEIFGDKNFLYQLSVVNNLNGNDNSSGMMETQEYCLIYAKNSEIFQMGVLPIEDEENDDWQIDERGYWKLGGSLKATGINAPRAARPNLFFPIYINEDTLEWSLTPFNGIEHQYELIPLTDGQEMSRYWSKEKFMNEQYGVIVKKVSTGYSLYKKQRPALGDMPSKRGKTTFYNAKYASANSNAELKKLFGGLKVFDYPKSVKFIEDLISLGYTNNSIILDFFSGSSTTAHACMQLNSLDGGNRKFIMVQMPENLDESLKTASSNTSKITIQNAISLCDKLGKPHFLSEIGKERIRRAAKKIKEETGADIDYGFRVYRVDESCMKDVYYHPSEAKQENLALFTSNIKDDRTSEDLLTQVILNLGLTLDLPIEEKRIKNNKVFYVAGNSLVACFDENVDFSIIEEIAKDQPLKMVLRDSSFRNDADRINFENAMKELSKDTIIKVI